MITSVPTYLLRELFYVTCLVNVVFNLSSKRQRLDVTETDPFLQCLGDPTKYICIGFYLGFIVMLKSPLMSTLQCMCSVISLRLCFLFGIHKFDRT